MNKSEGEGSILKTVLKSLELILLRLPRLLGRVAPLPEEEGVEGDGVLESSRLAEKECSVGTTNCRTSCLELVLRTTTCSVLCSG
jgi:hypothetical protein